VLVDRSEAMLRAASAAIAPWVGAAPAVLADAAALPISKRARFEQIVAMHVLPFVDAPRRVLAGLGARLVPGGHLLVTTPGTGDLAPVRRIVRDVLRARGLPW